MIELRFHEELYDGFAIDEAVKLYGPYAAFKLSRQDQGYVVQIEPLAGDDPVDPAVVAAELMNYALGKTIERARAATDIAPEATPAEETA
ncbi:MAG: HxsD-like protein [Polyangiaceae bacterium]